MLSVCAFGVIPSATAQSPPLLQCVGGKSIFAVSGDSLSTFRYELTGGVFLDTTHQDSIVVQWGTESGVYRIGVQEIAYGGCEGAWVYLDVELKGTPFGFDYAQYQLCPGDTLRIAVDAELYKDFRWSEPMVNSRGIVQPGDYQIWVEDQDGCKYTDQLKVVICDLPPIHASLIKNREADFEDKMRHAEK